MGKAEISSPVMQEISAFLHLLPTLLALPADLLPTLLALPAVLLEVSVALPFLLPLFSNEECFWALQGGWPPAKGSTAQLQMPCCRVSWLFSIVGSSLSLSH